MDKYEEKERRGIATVDFTVSACPKNIYLEFKDLCVKECGDNYTMALRHLMDKYKKDAMYVDMVEKLQSLDDTLAWIRDEMQILKNDIEDVRSKMIVKKNCFGGNGNE